MNYFLSLVAVIIAILLEFFISGLVLKEREAYGTKTFIFLFFYILMRNYLYHVTQPPLERLVIISTLLFIFEIVLFKGSLLKKFLAVGIVSLIVIPFDILCITIIGLFKDFSNELLEYPIQMIVYLVAISIILLIRSKVKGKELNISKKQRVYLLGISLSLFILTFFLLLSGYSLNENVSLHSFKLSYQHTGYVITMVMIFGVLLKINHRLLRIQEKQLKEKIYYQQKESYRHQLALVQKNQKQMRKIKHDYRNHLTAIRYFIKGNQKEEAMTYIDDLENFLIVKDEYVVTGEAMDSILNYKIHQAKMKDIEVTLDLDVQESLSIPTFDLTVVLGNLLDNAIEALEKLKNKRVIHLKMTIKKGIIGIHIKNSFNGEIAIKKGVLQTIKKEKELHGNGIKHIKDIVHRYNGSMDISYDAEEFNVKVLLYNN